MRVVMPAMVEHVGLTLQVHRGRHVVESAPFRSFFSDSIPYTRHPFLGFKIAPDHEGEWRRNFPRPLLPLQSTEKHRRRNRPTHDDVNLTSDHTFEKRKPFSPSSVPWWNHECGALATNLRFADDASRRTAKTALKLATTKAKREWANAVINEAQKEDLWRVAKFFHPCHLH